MTKVLVIDDDLDTAETLAECLSMEGHEVAYTLSAAAGALVSILYDVVITDYKMDDMYAPELIKYIRKYNPHIKIYVMSGEERKNIKGSNGFLLKPFNLNELFSLIDNSK